MKSYGSVLEFVIFVSQLVFLLRANAQLPVYHYQELRDEAKRVSLPVTLVNEPFAEVSNQLDQHMHQDSQANDEQQPRAG
jgi:glutamate formiminotransferase